MNVTTVREVELANERSGTGPTLVWGHGLSSSMAKEDLFGLLDWPTVRHVADVLRYDARGHGESESTAEPMDYHWRNLALDQLALVDALGIGSYIAGGASMGCATALHAALLAPGRITALLLAIPPTAWESRAAQQGTYEVSASLIEAGEIDLLVAGSRAAPSPDPLADIPQWKDGAEAALRAADSVRLARIFRGAAVADFPPADEIATLQIPTMILAWTGDPGHPMSTAERLVELMPHAELVTATTFAELVGWTSEAMSFLATLPR